MLRGLIAAAALALLSSTPVASQESARNPHPWAAFLGCWAPADAGGLAVTCVLPVNGSPFEVEQVHLVAGNVVRSVSLVADGARRDIVAAGCEGWETAAFSHDGARAYTRGNATCAANTEQLTSAVFSITPEGQFLQVAAVRVGEQRSVTRQRYDLLPWMQVPPVVQERLSTITLMAMGARTRAALPVDLDRVEDALQYADPFVVEAWMAETGVGSSRFKVTRTELQRLVAMNAPERIIDLSVALANPAHFAPRVERAGGGANVNPWANLMRSSSNLGSIQQLDAFCDQLAFGSFSWRGSYPLWSMVPGLPLAFNGSFPSCFGRGMYANWAFGPYPRFGYGYVGNWYGGPVVVTTSPRRVPPGTVTKGSGYTRGVNSSGSGSSGQPRENSGPSTVRAAGSSASAQSGGSASSGGTRSAGSNGTGRTAQPRNP